MSVITPKSEAFLKKYLNNASPTGFEASGQKLWLEYISAFWRVASRQLRNYYMGWSTRARITGWWSKACRRNLLVRALYFRWRLSSTSSATVVPTTSSPLQAGQHTPKKASWRSLRLVNHPHAPGEDAEMVPKPENIFIDWAPKTKDEVLGMGIHVGCVITYEDDVRAQWQILHVGRAWITAWAAFASPKWRACSKENKIGTALSLYLVNSVQGK